MTENLKTALIYFLQFVGLCIGSVLTIAAVIVFCVGLSWFCWEIFAYTVNYLEWSKLE